MAYLIDGKITGISGIVGPFTRGAAKCEPVKVLLPCFALVDVVDHVITDFMQW